MGTSKDDLLDAIHEQNSMLDYIKENYEEVYDEAEAHYMNLLTIFHVNN